MSLTDTERAMLAFESRFYRFPGARDQAIRDEFGISVTSYTQRLVALVQRPEAEAANPLVVRRLRRKIRNGRRRVLDPYPR